ncbi:hypothetical protein BI344_17720 [Chromobacterium sphagni]|uniref:G domain-containing protein n=2 Tax=Chromobacterium sphagni TaxID=1903179 RepID=A0ABX3CBF2_9NEIS|nr:hypothetical protein BI344_17720 [Chromobacterium sphagni]
MPGVGECQDKETEYAERYCEMLPRLDLILWVIKADDRALSIDAKCYKQLIRPHLCEHNTPLLFVVNPIDKEPSREWNSASKSPGLQ